MTRKLLCVGLTIAAGACTPHATSGSGDLATARAQVTALAEDRAGATFEGLDATRADGAICGRMRDPGAPISPVRFYLEPIGKRIHLDPASRLAIDGADAEIARCSRLRRDRAASFESIAACRPAETRRRERMLRRAFENRYKEVCG